MTRWQRSNEPFLLGLTATPYRGRDARETSRLVNRYGHNRLDAGAFASDDPRAVIAELQQVQVLARADHETSTAARSPLTPEKGNKRHPRHGCPDVWKIALQ